MMENKETLLRQKQKLFAVLLAVAILFGGLLALASVQFMVGLAFYGGGLTEGQPRRSKPSTIFIWVSFFASFLRCV